MDMVSFGSIQTNIWRERFFFKFGKKSDTKKIDKHSKHWIEIKEISKQNYISKHLDCSFDKWQLIEIDFVSAMHIACYVSSENCVNFWGF